MITSFSQMDKSSRIWIYQSNRKFIDSEVKEIEGLLTDFLKSWTAHGSKLQTAFLLKYNRFIIIALNESNVAATGCSIDSCVHFIQELESKYEVNLLDKMNISFKQGQYVSYKPIDDFKKLVKNKSDAEIHLNALKSFEKYKQRGRYPMTFIHSFSYC